MDEYAEEKRTEKNLIVRSGISEAETTNNKRLRSTFCIEAIQSTDTKHRAASLRQQSFLHETNTALLTVNFKSLTIRVEVLYGIKDVHGPRTSFIAMWHQSNR